MGTVSRVELLRETMPQLAKWQWHTLDKEQGDSGEKATAWIGGSSQA
jgi:hypothetical protein